MSDTNKITDQNQGKPGHLYCAVRSVWSAEHGGYLDSFDGLYWLGSDGGLYAVSNAVGEKDDEDQSYPEYDYLVEQVGAFDASYAS